MPKSRSRHSARDGAVTVPGSALTVPMMVDHTNDSDRGRGLPQKILAN
jgi:hypothetical protein